MSTTRRHNPDEFKREALELLASKGAGLAIPALLTWPGSAILHDIKGENWTLTAGWRGQFGRVRLFDPANPESSVYNPLLEVRRRGAKLRRHSGRRDP